MSQLIQLLIGRELARSKGIEDPADQLRIGAIAMIAPSPALGIVLANTIATREAPVERADGGHTLPPKRSPPPVAQRPAGSRTKPSEVRRNPVRSSRTARGRAPARPPYPHGVPRWIRPCTN